MGHLPKKGLIQRDNLFPTRKHVIKRKTCHSTQKRVIQRENLLSNAKTCNIERKKRVIHYPTRKCVIKSETVL